MSLEMNKIIFLHGFFASGSCEPALAMKEGMAGEAEVLTPDLPLHPGEALRFVRSLVEAERPQLLVGNSCGSFYGQIVALACGLPALLGNPYFKMSEFLSQRRGVQHYKSPRRDGRQTFVIDDTLIGEFAAIEKHQFDHCTAENRDKVWGLFGEKDTLAHFELLFFEHYTHAYRFPGAHTPTTQEVKDYYLPLARKMLENVSVGRSHRAATIL